MVVTIISVVSAKVGYKIMDVLNFSLQGLRVSPKRQWNGMKPALPKCMSTAVAQTRPLPLVMLTEEELAMKESGEYIWNHT